MKADAAFSQGTSESKQVASSGGIRQASGTFEKDVKVVVCGYVLFNVFWYVLDFLWKYIGAPPYFFLKLMEDILLKFS